MGKKDLGEHAGVVDARQAGLTISEAADKYFSIKEKI